MKLLVVGGTGALGRRVAQVAAGGGHEVVVLGRSATPTERWAAVAGDATDPAAVDRAVAGVDAVIMCLSIPRAGRSPWAKVVGPPDLHSRSAALFVEAMRRHGARRLIKVSAQGVGGSAARTGWGFRALVAASNLRQAFADHARADELVRGSGLDFTVVHPPRLSNVSGRGLVAGEDVRTGSLTTVSRDDLAAWLVDALQAEEWVGRTVSVGPRIYV